MTSESSKSKSPLTGIVVAIALFVVTVAMHEAARANDLAATSAQDGGGASAPSGTRLRANFLSIPDSIHANPQKGRRSLRR